MQLKEPNPYPLPIAGRGTGKLAVNFLRLFAEIGFSMTRDFDWAWAEGDLGRATG
jgi:hypothetical protein